VCHGPPRSRCPTIGGFLVRKLTHHHAATIGDLNEIALGAVVVAHEYRALAADEVGMRGRARRGFAHAFDEIDRPEPPADARPPGPGGRTIASGNTRSPSCARPVRHARYVRLPDEKNSLPGKKANLPGKKANLPGEKANLLGEKANLPGEKANLPDKKNSLFGKKTSLFGAKL
jgi:hypothetical protein